jgi:hypothetical protein
LSAILPIAAVSRPIVADRERNVTELFAQLLEAYEGVASHPAAESELVGADSGRVPHASSESPATPND